MTFCTQCGTALGSSDKFCGGCGTLLSKRSVSMSEVVARNQKHRDLPERVEPETEGSDQQKESVYPQTEKESPNAAAKATKKRTFWRNAVLAFFGVGVVAAIAAAFIPQSPPAESVIEISEGCWGCTPAQLENIRENQKSGALEICESVELLEEIWESPGDISEVWYANNRLSLRISTSDLDADSELVILAKAMHDTFKVLQAFANEGPQTEEEVEIMQASLDTLDSAFNVTLRQCEIEGVS